MKIYFIHPRERYFVIRRRHARIRQSRISVFLYISLFFFHYFHLAAHAKNFFPICWSSLPQSSGDDPINVHDATCMCSITRFHVRPGIAWFVVLLRAPCTHYLSTDTLAQRIQYSVCYYFFPSHSHSVILFTHFFRFCSSPCCARSFAELWLDSLFTSMCVTGVSVCVLRPAHRFPTRVNARDAFLHIILDKFIEIKSTAAFRSFAFPLPVARFFFLLLSFVFDVFRRVRVLSFFVFPYLIWIIT